MTKSNTTSLQQDGLRVSKAATNAAIFLGLSVRQKALMALSGCILLLKFGYEEGAAFELACCISLKPS